MVCLVDFRSLLIIIPRFLSTLDFVRVIGVWSIMTNQMIFMHVFFIQAHLTYLTFTDVKIHLLFAKGLCEVDKYLDNCFLQCVVECKEIYGLLQSGKTSFLVDKVLLVDTYKTSFVKVGLYRIVDFFFH